MAHLSKHEAHGAPRNAPLGIQIVQMVHNELSRGGKVGLVEFVRDVPAQSAKLPTFLKLVAS